MRPGTLNPPDEFFKNASKSLQKHISDGSSPKRNALVRKYIFEFIKIIFSRNTRLLGTLSGWR